ncbi:hypothetical protein K7711_34540 [Nocardia sp. CA2R105]|uniref:nSTAND1 domain-containing NTPase n=1 Tax=Nocardia coffeae TaxID=2873381 RepID=UPI001CA74D56|nr:WD40 repeat domain-containing protein [Nocardia coffeae]MBY8861638.1 hypothetical protein [Nocardia coffeae]
MDSGSAGRGRLRPSPRTQFSERFVELFEAAGNPTLRRVAAASGARMRAARASGQPGGVPVQRISDWKAGRNVPAKFETLLPVLLTLIDEARKSSRPVRPALLDVREWQRLWTASNEWDPNSDAADVVCPYLGLSAYRAEDAEVFFGRTRPTTELAELVRTTTESGDGGMVLLVGASGAGKSSLLQAGLIPALADPVREWAVATMTPGDDPVAALLSAITDSGGNDPGETDSDTADPIASALEQWGRGRRRLLVVDQLEELFTLCRDEFRRETFLSILENLAIRGESDTTAVVLAVRADFYARCLDEPVLEDALKHRSYLLGPMRLDELAEALTKPAEVAGYKLESGLDELVISELCGLGGGGDRRSYDPGALPLVSHVMEAVWQRREGSRLTIDGYRSAGGVLGSVSATAEKAWAQLTDFQQGVGKQVLLGLVAVGDDSRDTRRKVSRAELLRQTVDAADAALDALARTRLITLEADIAYLTHEIVLDAWPRLRSWIDADRVGYLERQRLQVDAADWIEHGRDPSLLYRGARLATVGEHARKGPLGPGAEEFLAASETARRRARRRSQVRRSALVLLTVVSVALAGVAFLQSRKASEQRDSAIFNSVLAEADRVETSDPSLSAQLDLMANRLRPGDPEVRARLVNSEGTPLASELAAQQGAITGTALRPDGRVLASVGSDQSVRLWDTSDPRNPRPIGQPLTEPPNVGGALAFSPDGTTLAVLGAHHGVALWDVRNPVRPTRIGDLIPAGFVDRIAFAPDGRTLVVPGKSGGIEFWDITDPRQPRLLGPPVSNDTVRSIALSADFHRLVLTSDDGVQLWQLDDHFGHATLIDRITDSSHTVSLSPDGRTVATLADDSIALWDVSVPGDPQRIGRPITGAQDFVGSPLVFSGDGRTLAAVGSNGQVMLWDLNHPTQPVAAAAPLAGAKGFVDSIVFAPDGHAIMAAGQDGLIRLWSRPESVLRQLPQGNVLAAESNVVAVSDGSAIEVWRIDAAMSAHRIGRIETGEADSGVQPQISPDGRTLALFPSSGDFRLYDLSGSGGIQPLATIEKSGYMYTAASFSSDSRSLFLGGQPLATGSDHGQFQVWDIADRAHPVPTAGPVITGTFVMAGRFLPGNRYLAIGDFSGTVDIWDTSGSSSSTRVAQLEAGQAVSGIKLRFTPDGRALMGTADDESIHVWDTTDPRKPVLSGPPLAGHDAYIGWLAVDSGNQLISVDVIGTARLWNLTDRRHPTGTRHALISAATARPGPVTFLPDGHHLVGTGADGRARLWDLDTDSAVARICDITRTTLTPEVWREHLPDLPYRPPCR